MNLICVALLLQCPTVLQRKPTGVQIVVSLKHHSAITTIQEAELRDPLKSTVKDKTILLQEDPSLL
jgi:hypothetical protein